ncbi:hypothetical protein NX059_001198 [Plenodomus lindquistii]|nr:hypothetical protein NX059_001198 [Plenodomus lindquistii]
MSHHNPSHGQKVTTDPESQRNPIHEGVGTVTSDSLAAESLKDGSFGTDNPKASASQQPSASTTTNNTDTSNATRLDPAVDAHARDAKSSSNEEATLSTKGLGRESGVGPTYNTLGSGKNSRGDTIGVSTGSSGGVDGVQGNIAPREGYADGDREVVDGVGKPKGRGLVEDENLHGERKVGEIGTRSDPGRVAEQELLKKASAVGGGDKGGVSGDGAFEALKRDEEA